jgi:hypothetical protein
MAESRSRAGNSFESACVYEKQSLGETGARRNMPNLTAAIVYGPQEKYLNRGGTFESLGGS